MNWSDLIFGKYNIKIVLEVVKQQEWQDLRVSLLGKPLEFKYKQLKHWLALNNHSEKSKIQVTNYVYALKRGGLIK